MPRSPNYPAMGLPEAIELANKIYGAEKRTSLTEQRIAALLGYASLSGPSRTKISALKKYGLLSQEGDKLKLTERALTILHRPKIAPDYKQAILGAVNSIDLFRKLLETHRDASDETIHSHLTVDHHFTEDGAKAFIKAFASTKSLAFSGTGAKIEEERGRWEEPQEGDLVLWESQGVQQFPEPRKVLGLSLDRKFVFVEGSQTGLPVEEVSVSERPDKPGTGKGLSVDEGARGEPPRSPFIRNPAMPSGTNQDVFTLDEGQAILAWPANLSAGSFQDLEDWLKLALRKIRRSIGEPLPTPPPSEQD